jgi:C1A family cysteine protease
MVLFALTAGLLGAKVVAAEREVPEGADQLSESVEVVYNRGFILPPFESHHLEIRVPKPLAPFPTRFDWREQGILTSVQDQGSCGSCFCFAALAALESQLLIADEGEYDFSEDNVKNCEYLGYTNHPWVGGCKGGTFWMVTNFLSQKGTVLEQCDHYTSSDGACYRCCAYIKTVVDWRAFSIQEIPLTETTKYYLQTYGPISVAMDAGDNADWRQEFKDYDGSYTLHWEPTAIPDHAVLIVGWDDTLSHAGGQGAWIVKNSKGPQWGGTCGYGTERGYFTIAYGSATLGWYSAFFREWKDYEASDLVLLHDEAGYWDHTGFGSTTAWGMCKFVPESDVLLERVEFWTTDVTTDVDVYVYDSFGGSRLSDLLASELDNSFGEMGYMSVELSTPISLSAGNAIYVAVKFTNVILEMPLAFDPIDYGPRAAGMCYYSAHGATWQLFQDGDLGIRIRVERETDPPDTVSSFTGVAGDATVTIGWTNPADPDFSHTMIRYSSNDYPTTVCEGYPVKEDKDGKFFSSPASVDSFVHTRLSNNVTYYYSAFAGDGIENYASPVKLTVTPFDTVPPGPVASFSATGRNRSVELDWTAPDDYDVEAVMITYTDRPGHSVQWDPVENGNQGIFATAPDAVGSFVHADLSSDSTYCYSIVALDEMGNTSDSDSACAVPVDSMPPVLSIAFFQNPLITNHLDIYITAGEPLIDTSLVVSVEGEETDAEPVNTEGSIYKCDYDVYESPGIGVDVSARDLSLNWGTAHREFSSSHIMAGTGGIARSVDGLLEVGVPAGVLSRDMFVLIHDEPGTVASVATAYGVSPPSVVLDGMAIISIVYGSGVNEPERLCVARLEDDRACPLDSYVDRTRGRIVAYGDRFGAYGLHSTDGVMSEDYDLEDLRLLQNAPNPFTGVTTVSYEIARPTQLRLDIVTVEGRLVRTLWQGIAAPGRHRIDWDGTDSRGRRVTSGVYLYRVAGDVGTATRKMVLLR